MLTQEKTNLITEYLSRDIEYTKTLLDKAPEEVAAELTAAGIECSVEEIVAYGKALDSAVASLQSDELDESSLDQVAGGVVITGTLILGLAGCLAAGAAVGGIAVTGTYHVVKHGW